MTLLAVVCGLQLSAQTIVDAEAFYIYRNDGDFNGFFYDEVKEMRYSKIDLDSVAHDEYVVQDVVTKDSVYRIPLCAIDSIGFVQPDIIISEKLKHYVDGPAITPCDFNVQPLFDKNDPYVAYWPLSKGIVIKDGFPVETVADAPAVGEIIYYPSWKGYTEGYSSSPDFESSLTGDFVARVKEVVDIDEDFVIRGKTVKKGCCKKLICEPIEDITDIYERYIAVEQIGTDENGLPVRRMAGRKNMKRRISGDKEMTLVDISINSNYHPTVPDGFEVSLGIVGDLKVTGRILYNISTSNCDIKFEFEESGEVGLGLTCKGTLYEEVTMGLAGVAEIPVPSFLPIMSLRLGPDCFLATQADLSLTVKTPKFKFKKRQTLHLGVDVAEGSNSDNTSFDDDDNGWDVNLSLNGSVHYGLKQEFRFGTHSWAKRIFKADIGMDVKTGPKISASFDMDLTKKNIHGLLKGSNISLTGCAVDYEASAKAGAAGKEKTYKFLEGSIELLKYSLNVFPDFSDTEGKVEPFGVADSGVQYSSRITPTIHPTGDTPFYKLGTALTTMNDSLLAHKYSLKTYSFLDSYSDLTFEPFYVTQGDFKVVPYLSCPFGTVYAWDCATEVHADLPLTFSIRDNGTVAIMIFGLLEGDVVTFERISHEGQGSCSVKEDQEKPEWYHNPDESISTKGERWKNSLFQYYWVNKTQTGYLKDVYRFTATSVDGLVRTVDVPLNFNF